MVGKHYALPIFLLCFRVSAKALPSRAAFVNALAPTGCFWHSFLQTGEAKAKIYKDRVTEALIIEVDVIFEVTYDDLVQVEYTSRFKL